MAWQARQGKFGRVRSWRVSVRQARRGRARQGAAGKEKGGVRMIYDWKRNMPVKAQEAGEYLETLEKTHGAVTPKLILEVSRPRDSILHTCFEWDDGIAAEKYRESQANYIVRNLVVVKISGQEEEQPPVRAFVSVTKEDTRKYVSIKTALNDESMTKEVLGQAFAELAAFSKKYRQLKELSSVFEVIDELLSA